MEKIDFRGDFWYGQEKRRTAEAQERLQKVPRLLYQAQREPPCPSKCKCCHLRDYFVKVFLDYRRTPLVIDVGWLEIHLTFTVGLLFEYVSAICVPDDKECPTYNAEQVVLAIKVNRGDEFRVFPDSMRRQQEWLWKKLLEISKKSSSK